MKKLIASLLIFIVVVIGVLLVKNNFSTAQANGVILYGDEKKIQQNIENLDNKKLKTVFQGNYKLLDQTMVLKQDDVLKMVEKGLIYLIEDNENVIPVKKFAPRASEIEYWGKKEIKQKNINGNDVKVYYTGNKIIGMGRCVALDFIIVDEKTYASIDTSEYTLKAVYFEDNPKNLLTYFKDIDTQLTEFSK